MEGGVKNAAWLPGLFDWVDIGATHVIDCPGGGAHPGGAPRPLEVGRQRLGVSRDAPESGEGGDAACPRYFRRRGPALPIRPGSGTSGGPAILPARPWVRTPRVGRPLFGVMSAFAPLLLRGLTGGARRLPVPRAQVHSKPPREQLSTMDKAVGLTASFLCFLVPGGWVLSHLDSYKKRE